MAHIENNEIRTMRETPSDNEFSEKRGGQLLPSSTKPERVVPPPPPPPAPAQPNAAPSKNQD